MFSISVRLIFLVDCDQMASEMSLDGHQCPRNEVKVSAFNCFSADTCHFFVTGIIMNQLAPHIKYFKV